MGIAIASTTTLAALLVKTKKLTRTGVPFYKAVRYVLDEQETHEEQPYEEYERHVIEVEILVDGSFGKEPFGDKALDEHLILWAVTLEDRTAVPMPHGLMRAFRHYRVPTKDKHERDEKISELCSRMGINGNHVKRMLREKAILEARTDYLPFPPPSAC